MHAVHCERAVKCAPDGHVADIALTDRADHVEMDWVPSEAKGLPVTWCNMRKVIVRIGGEYKPAAWARRSPTLLISERRC